MMDPLIIIELINYNFKQKFVRDLCARIRNDAIHSKFIAKLSVIVIIFNNL